MTEPRAGIRSRREGWADSVKVTLTERDIELFLMLWISGVLRTRDVVRLRFGSRGTANDRLRKLFCAGYIDCFTRDLTGDNYYVLTPRGRDAVLDAQNLDPDAYRLVRKLPAKLDHSITTTEIRIHLALACGTGTSYALVHFETDADLGRARHAALLDLVPDAKVELRSRATGEAHHFFVEVDTGTEALTWLVRHKLAVYARHAQIGTDLYGVRDPLVVLVVPGLRRARNIARAMASARIAARVVFTLRSFLDETTVLAAAYALPADLLAAPATADAAAILARRLLP